MQSLLRRLREMVQRRQLTNDLDEELRFHLELEIDHNVSRGMSGQEARRAALLAFGGVPRFREEVAGATARARLTMLLLSLAAAVTLGLGAVGLYSVIAYAVVGLVFREGLIVAGLGAAAGIALSLAGAGLIRGVLYEVSAANPWAAVAAAALLAITAFFATYLPARRAGQTDPARALRGA